MFETCDAYISNLYSTNYKSDRHYEKKKEEVKKSNA